MPDTKTIQTRHGNIDYATDTCNHCNDEKLKENIVDVVVGSYFNKNNPTKGPHAEVRSVEDQKYPTEKSICRGCAKELFGIDVVDDHPTSDSVEFRARKKALLFFLSVVFVSMVFTAIINLPPPT